MIKFSKKQLNNILQPTDHIEMEVNEGTPRSGKTSSDCIKMMNYYMNTEDPNHLIVAYSQEQAYRMAIDSGDEFGLIALSRDVDGKELFHVKHDEKGDHVYIPQNNKGIAVKIYYKGGGKVNAVGAITGMSLGSVWFLEYNLIHPDFIDECFRRTMAAKNRYHLAEMNPPAPNHPNIDKFKIFENDGRYLWRHWDIYDNPVFTDERRKSLYNQFSASRYIFNRDWLGLRVLPEGVVYQALDISSGDSKHIADLRDMEKEQYIETIYTGDGGSSDATTLSMNIITRDYVTGRFHYWRVANYYHSNRDTGDSKSMNQYANELMLFMQWCLEKFPFTRNYTVYIDPACKSLRDALREKGLQVYKADNNSKENKKVGTGAGSKLENGIEYGNSILSEGLFHLVELDDFFDERTGLYYNHENFKREAGLYVRHDKTKKPVDGNNHALDEFRYMNNYFYKNYAQAQLGV